MALQGACRESTTIFVASKSVCMIVQCVCSGRFLVADEALFTMCYVLANAVNGTWLLSPNSPINHSVVRIFIVLEVRLLSPDDALLH